MIRPRRIGSLRFDTRTGELWRRGAAREEAERLRPQARDLLCLFLEADGDVVTRAQIRDRLWGSDRIEADSAINNLVADLRRRLDGPGGTGIETLPRLGYRLAPNRRESRRLTVPIGAGIAATLAIVALALWAVERRSAGPVLRGEAHEAFEKARYLLEGRPGAHAARALEELERVVRLEPGFGPGWAWTAQAQLDLAQQDATRLPEARQAVLRALQIDRRDPVARGVAAQLALFHDWDFDGARRHFARAIETDQAIPRVRFGLAMLHALEGRHDHALRELEAARRRDPVSTLLRGESSWFLFRARRYEEAIAQAEEVLRLEPGHRYALLCRLEAASALGREDEAVGWIPAVMHAFGADADQVDAVRREAEGDGLVAYRRWYAGRVLANPRSRRSAPSVAIAAAGVRDAEGFFAALETAWRERSGFLFLLDIDPRFDPFRDDPRFAEMLRRVRAARQPARS